MALRQEHNLDLPDRVDKSDVRAFAHLPQRAELARLTQKAAAYSRNLKAFNRSMLLRFLCVSISITFSMYTNLFGLPCPALPYSALPWSTNPGRLTLQSRAAKVQTATHSSTFSVLRSMVGCSVSSILQPDSAAHQDTLLHTNTASEGIDNHSDSPCVGLMPNAWSMHIPCVMTVFRQHVSRGIAASVDRGCRTRVPVVHALTKHWLHAEVKLHPCFCSSKIQWYGQSQAGCQ